MTSRRPRISSGDVLAKLFERFRAEQPEQWDACRRWPTESGLLHMIEVMRR